ncbi:uncharacterized protein CMC5_046930 [Chondromyces crocatus]|uniref:Uncharacterized protein n=1 Tax=Chondromyces crocatus TaxID=52 RepID=A0A0K1EIW6_CHOCO|nr:uncharacterized protein CMC5_046930 [Chondromyces crocatus]
MLLETRTLLSFWAECGTRSQRLVCMISPAAREAARRA